MISLKSLIVFMMRKNRNREGFFSKAKQFVNHFVPVLLFFFFKLHTESNQW